MRHLIYKIVGNGSRDNHVSLIYDEIITVVIFVSLIPMMLKSNEPWERTLDIITADILLFDYMLKWMTYDIRRGEEGKVLPFVLYFIKPLSLATFISLLPSFGILGESWRILRMLRILTLFGYSVRFEKIINVFKRKKDILGLVLVIALMYIFATALLMFVVEPDTFKDFFDAIYWSTTALTTIGYGDIYPHTDIGKLISIISSLLGIAIIALPAGIITSGFMEEINAEKENGTALPVFDRKRKNSFKGFMTPDERAAVPRYLLIMACATLVNLGLLAICKALRLPMWLDTAGTVFTAVMLEPAAGIIVGFLTNCFETYSTYEGAIMYFMTSAVAAIVPGLLLRTKKGEIRKNMFLPAMVLTTATTSIVATLQNLIINAGHHDNYWEIKFSDFLGRLNLPVFYRVFFPIALCKVFDMVVIFLILWIISKSEPLMNMIHGIEDDDTATGGGAAPAGGKANPEVKAKSAGSAAAEDKPESGKSRPAPGGHSEENK